MPGQHRVVTAGRVVRGFPASPLPQWGCAAHLGKGWEKTKAAPAMFKWPEAPWRYFGATLISVAKVCVFWRSAWSFIEICENFILS